MDLWSLYCPKGILQILICSHIYNQGNVLGISCGRVFVSVQYRSCCNLDMLIDICHIFQIYLNYNCFYFWSEVYLWYFLLWRRFLRLEFLNSFVMNFVSLPTYVNLAIFVFSFFFYCLFYFQLGCICSRVIYHIYYSTLVIRKVSTVCAYLPRFLESVTLRMCSDFLYRQISNRRHFVRFVTRLCLFLCVKHV